MRTINKEIIISKQVVENCITDIAIAEELVVISEDKPNQTVFVQVSYKNSAGDELSRENYTITGSSYALLMAENPDFAPGKPANEYREADLWYVIDLMRNA